MFAAIGPSLTGSKIPDTIAGVVQIGRMYVGRGVFGFAVCAHGLHSMEFRMLSSQMYIAHCCKYVISLHLTTVCSQKVIRDVGGEGCPHTAQ